MTVALLRHAVARTTTRPACPAARVYFSSLQASCRALSTSWSHASPPRLPGPPQHVPPAAGTASPSPQKHQAPTILGTVGMEPALPTSKVATPAAIPTTPATTATTISTATEVMSISETVHGRLRVYTIPAPVESSSSSSGSDGVDRANRDAAIVAAAEPLHWTWRSEDGQNQAHNKWFDVSKLAPFLRSTFLPVGYPHSVHPTYARFHMWKAAETGIASIIWVLSSQALLSALNIGASQPAGVQAAMAAGSAAAVKLILKDGLGEIGKLALIQQFSSQFDARLRTWKLAGEGASVAAVLFNMLTLVAPGPAWFLPLASIGGALKSFYITLWSTVHASFARQWAAKANLADILAKDEAQLSVASMAGAGIGVALIALVRYDAPFLFGTFAVLAPVQMACSVAMLRSTHFTMLTDIKLSFLVRHWRDLHHSPLGGIASRTVAVDTGIPTIADSHVLEMLPEHGFMGEFVRPSPRVPKVHLGIGLAELYAGLDAATAARQLSAAGFLPPSPSPSTNEPLAGSETDPNEGTSPQQHARRPPVTPPRYLVHWTPEDVRVSLRSDARTRDIAQAMYYAVVVHEAQGDHGAARAAVRAEFNRFWTDLSCASAVWDSKRVYFDDRGVRFTLGDTGATPAVAASVEKSNAEDDADIR
ncbi:vitamin B6 photo-protection and homoeostasis-domain-containing protein [Blastocladiella britannica]|nr:vitamin B6 photo-protection and homoeostasis-domain-containing protein [Blastocladiella britannica]